ncbi:MAG: alanine dehydrogenase [Gammaproteobacteria bacterium]|nr:alanine dehydrogenase [Gammaproteobacteria bacterium]
MKIGIPKETKADEYRVALLPVGAQLLAADGHEVYIETHAGRGSGYHDSEYREAGAQVVDSADAVLEACELLVKVKEPQPGELERYPPSLIVFGYFHFAGSRALTESCLDRSITALAYETLTDARGELPLLKPMSEVAGKMSIQEGAKCLEKPFMGRGILLGGVAGVPPANVLVLGAGVVGANAAKVAAGLGANVTIMDIDIEKLRHIDEIMPDNVTTVYSDPHAVRQFALQADLVIGALLIPGARAPRLIRRDMLKEMKRGAVLVDVSIDQGGCFETSRPTSHRDPVYVIDDIVHYCVPNIPGAVGRTSSQALCNATLPYVRKLAGLGLNTFLEEDRGLRQALNVHAGVLCHPGVAGAFPDLPSRADAR